jgi:hypothetical protein
MTLCGIFPAPFAEDFEMAAFPPACWTQSTGTQLWARSVLASGYGVGTASARANFYSYSSNAPFHLMTLNFDASALYAPVLKFDYAYATYATEVDSLVVYYSTNSGVSYTSLLAMPGGPTGILNTGGALGTAQFVPAANQWATRTIPLPAGTNMIRFTGISNYGNNLFLDNVKVEASPCAMPTLLTAANITAHAANLGWTEMGTASLWDIEYGPAGFVPGSGTLVSGISTNPYPLAGLTSSTNYEFRVRAKCGATTYSNWTAMSPFTTLSGIPFNNTVENVTVTSAECFDATNIIYVAGGTTYFTVMSGGSATFIAGVSISFLPGTTVQNQGYLHGLISTGTYCGGATPSLPAVKAAGQEETVSFEQAFFTLYPNPTNGNFTLVQKGDRQFGNVKVEIYGMRGDKVLSSQMIGEKKHEFMTSSLPAGIYFVKVVADNYTETIKLIKTR